MHNGIGSGCSEDSVHWTIAPTPARRRALKRFEFRSRIGAERTRDKMRELDEVVGVLDAGPEAIRTLDRKFGADWAMVQSAAGGCRHAVRCIVERVYLVGLRSHELDDALQSWLLRFVQRPDLLRPYRGDCPLDALLIQCLRNERRSMRRRQNKQELALRSRFESLGSLHRTAPGGDAISSPVDQEWVRRNLHEWFLERYFRRSGPGRPHGLAPAAERGLFSITAVLMRVHTRLLNSKPVFLLEEGLQGLESLLCKYGGGGRVRMDHVFWGAEALLEVARHFELAIECNRAPQQRRLRELFQLAQKEADVLRQSLRAA